MNSKTQTILAQLKKVKTSVKGWTACCPAHEDSNPSLSIDEGDDGKVLLHCHVGCKTEEIVAALGLTMADLFPESESKADSPRSKPSRADADPDRNWPNIATQFAKQFSSEYMQQLALILGLPVEAFEAMPLIGYYLKSDCFTFPETDAKGKVIGIITRRLRDGQKKALKGSKRGLSTPLGWQDRPGPVYLVEGPSDTLAMTAAGLSAVGRPSNTGGVAYLVVLLGSIPNDREIVVVGENDQKENGLWPGRHGAESVAVALSEQLHRPVKIAFPPEESKDVRAWLVNANHGETSWCVRGEALSSILLANSREIDREMKSTPTSSPPTIIIGTDEYRVNEEAIKALQNEPTLFQRGGNLVHVVEQECHSEEADAIRREAGSAVIRDLPKPLLREKLAQNAIWLKEDARSKDALKPAHPPHWTIDAVYARGQWPGIRKLRSIATHPIILPDGSVLASNGYHKGTGVLTRLPRDLSITVPDQPTKADVDKALQILLDPFTDFPFADSTHKASLLAGLLTPLGWHAFEGSAPLFLIDKNVRGAGAGLLADVVAYILTGHRFPVMTYTNDCEELRKRITSIAIQGGQMVLLDNVTGEIGNSVLDAALTSTTWKDRLLGENRMYDGPLEVCWWATGNNVQLRADTSRRICHIRMETPEERPELRGNFKYPNLLEFVKAHRSSILSAALTIMRGWFVAGKPKHNFDGWGSFQPWSNLIREIVVFSGMPDPGETRLALQDSADIEASAMQVIIDGIERMDPARKGLSTATIIQRLKAVNDDSESWMSEVKSAVEELCGKLESKNLGTKFRSLKNRNFNGKMLMVAGTDRTKTSLWKVSQVAFIPPNHNYIAVHKAEIAQPAVRPTQLIQAYYCR